MLHYRYCLGTVVLCGWVSAISAEPIRITHDPAASTDPYICGLGDGSSDLSIVWIDSRTGTASVYLTRVSVFGNKLIGDFRVSGGSAAASLPSCGVDSTGDTHVVWKESNTLKYARVSAAGIVEAGPSMPIATPIDYPHVDVDPTPGNPAVHIVWVSTASPRQVKYRKLSASGGVIGGCGEKILDTADASISTEYPSVLAPGSGNTYAFMSWHGDNAAATQHMNVSLAYPNCNTINGPFQQTNNLLVGRSAMVPLLGSENVYLVFEGTVGGGQHVYWLKNAGIYAAVDQGPGPATLPDIASFNDQDPFVVWQDDRTGVSQVYSQAIDGPTGNLVGGNCLLSNGVSAAHNPSVVRGGSNSFAVVWDDSVDGAAEIYLTIAARTCNLQNEDLIRGVHYQCGLLLNQLLATPWRDSAGRYDLYCRSGEFG